MVSCSVRGDEMNEENTPKYYYKLDEDGNIKQCLHIQNPSDEIKSEYLETEREIVVAPNGALMFADEIAGMDFTPEPPTIEEIKQGLITLVQQHLDAKCQSMGYDNGFACASYATSSVPKFKAEAEAFVLWRDRVWSYCYEQLDLFEAGQREIPTDIIAELPDWSGNV